MMVSNLGNKFWQRDRNADDISDLPLWQVGLSMTASWAAGISLVIGMVVMHSKGILPFIVWAIPNSLAVPFFALLYTRYPNFRKWPRLTPFLALLVIEVFWAITMEMKFLNSALVGGTSLPTYSFLSQGFATYIVMGLSFLIAVYIHKKGLRGSMVTDVGQYSLQMVGTLALIVAGLALGTRADVAWVAQGTGNWWLSTSALAILVAVLNEGSQWQRFQGLENTGERVKAAGYAGLFFGGYMVMVGLAAMLFEGTMIMSGILLATLLFVSTSTLDSAMAALQWIPEQLDRSPYWGSALAAAAILSWPFLTGSTVAEHFQAFLDSMMKIMLAALGLTAIYSISRSERAHELARKYSIVADGNLLTARETGE